MSLLYNLARMTTPTTGTGTITLGSAVSGYLSFSTAGVTDQQIVGYGIRDGANSEVGFGLYTAAGTSLTRNVTTSTNSNAPISLSGTAEVFITARAQDFVLQPLPPGGRLTLVSGQPVVTTIQTAKTTIYYTPYIGNYVPLYDGQSFIPTEFAELAQTTTDTTKSPAAVTADGCYDLFVWNDAGTIRCTRGPQWANASTVTITIASPAVITWNGHGLVEGAPVFFTNSGGALPTGITANTVYYVTRQPAANTFNISTSVLNAMNNSRVNTSGSQSGTQTCTARALKSRGTGAGTGQLTLTKGIYLNTNAITNGPAALRGTYVGTVRSDSASTINYMGFAAGSGGAVIRMDVWNMYNRVLTQAELQDNGSPYNYTSNTVRSARGSINNRIWFTIGQVGDSVTVTRFGDVAADASSTGVQAFGLAFDDTTAIGEMAISNYTPATLITGCAFEHTLFDVVGSHFVHMAEFGDNTTAAQFRADNNSVMVLQFMA